MPEDDREQMYVLPVSSSATADFAAVTALASGIYREFDKAFSGRLLKSSCAAYEWLEKYPGFIGFDNPEGCETGVYGERNDRDNRFWAAAELFAIFDNEMYYARLLNLLNENFSLTSLGFASVGGFGSLALLLHNRGNAAVLSKLRSAFLAKAEKLAKVCDSNGWGVSLKPDQYNWGSNMTVLTNGMTFLIADYLEKRSINGDPHFRKYAAMQLDYILGVNATGYSYITGTGSLCVNYPHHRPAHADKVEECIPGLVSGGANSRLDDKFARALIPKGTPPMKCFSDNMECYSLNEVTIYWNSPAVFLLDSGTAWQREALACLQDAWQAVADEPPDYENEARYRLTTVLRLLGAQCEEGGGVKVSQQEQIAAERMKQMLRFVEEHYAEELTVERIAACVALSESACLRSFRQLLGITPIQYVKQFRVEKAAELLRSTRLRTGEIGAECGFADGSYFIKTFRELKHCTPKEYRQRFEAQ